MSTLDKIYRDNILGHMIFAIFIVVFGAIYEKFSHEVYSYYMIYAFMIPLCLGSLAYLLASKRAKKEPRNITVSAWNAVVVTLTIGSIFQGILEIYGTTNRLVWFYPVAAILFLLIAIGSKFLNNRKIVEEMESIQKIQKA
ncbi:MAG: hypothetical protein HXM41_06650 [Lachnospiraceae bacterium]|nr:hypothetical protein [Lachnospiraceae bacterium]